MAYRGSSFEFSDARPASWLVGRVPPELDPTHDSPAWLPGMWSRLQRAYPRLAHGLAWLTVQCATVALLFGLALWSVQFPLNEPAVPVIWPAPGVALALMYRFGYSTAIGVAIGVAAVQLYVGQAWTVAILLAAGSVAAGIAGTALLRRSRFDRKLARLRDVVILLLVGAGVSATLSALCASIAAAGTPADFAAALSMHWPADSMGVLLLTPLLICLDREAVAEPKLETLLWLALAVGLALIVYTDVLPAMVALPLSYAVFPLAMALALRRSAAVVSIVVLAVAAIAIGCTATGKGPFAQAELRYDLLALHAQFAMLVVSALLLSAARRERDHAEGEARQHMRTLAHAGRLNAMSTMAAGIAHEINQPLCAVNSYSQAARRLVRQGKTGDDLEQVLTRIIEGNEKASGIVRRIRGFLRPSDGDQEIHDFDALVADSLELLRPEFQRWGIQMYWQPAQEGFRVRGNGVELGQVVVNLVQNALEAAAESVSQSRRWVRIKTRRVAQGEQIELVVIDGGPGLPNTERNLLFEPLVSARANGTGLGLAIARTIVENHGGAIYADNTAAGGAEFRVRLNQISNRGE